MKKAIVWTAIACLLALTTHADTCKISTGSGLLLDTDCDGTPDANDPTPTGQEHAQDHDTKETTHTPRKTQTPQTQETINLDVQAITFRDFETHGPGAVYPVTVTNNGPDTDVTVFLRNVTGTYSVNPSSATTISKGEKQTFYIHLTTDTPGTHNPLAIIKADNYTQTLTLTAHVHPPQQSEMTWNWALLILALLILITIGYYTWEYTQAPETTEDEEIDSYY